MDSPDGATRQVPARRILIPDGDVRWLFRSSADAVGSDAVADRLAAADAVLAQMDAQLPHADKALAGRGPWLAETPSNRLYYRQLPWGTVVDAIAGSDDVLVEAALWPRLEPGRPERWLNGTPSWLVSSALAVSCDGELPPTGPPMSEWHTLDLRDRTVSTLLAAAELLLEDVVWLADLATREDLTALRSRDPRRGHPWKPPARD